MLASIAPARRLGLLTRGDIRKTLFYHFICAELKNGASSWTTGRWHVHGSCRIPHRCRHRHLPIDNGRSSTPLRSRHFLGLPTVACYVSLAKVLHIICGIQISRAPHIVVWVASANAMLRLYTVSVTVHIRRLGLLQGSQTTWQPNGTLFVPQADLGRSRVVNQPGEFATRGICSVERIQASSRIP